MAYNVASLIDEVIDQSKDSSFSRPRVLTFLQRTQDQVLGRQRYLFSESTLTETLGSGSLVFQYDCDHQEIIQVVLSHADLGYPAQPEYLTNQEFFARFPLPENNPAGLPRYYTDFGGELYWDVPLDKQYSIAMRYIEASGELEDNTDCRPTIPREFSDIYVNGGLAGVEQYRENFDIAAVYKREVEDLAEDLLGRYGLRKRQPGKARTIRRQGHEW